jgi:hypothetical protein
LPVYLIKDGGAASKEWSASTRVYSHREVVL